MRDSVLLFLAPTVCIIMINFVQHFAIASCFYFMTFFGGIDKMILKDRNRYLRILSQHLTFFHSEQRLPHFLICPYGITALL